MRPKGNFPVELDGAGTGIVRWSARPKCLFNGRSSTMLWTILVILVIIALAFFIFGRMRGGRGGV